MYMYTCTHIILYGAAIRYVRVYVHPHVIGDYNKVGVHIEQSSNFYVHGVWANGHLQLQ